MTRRSALFVFVLLGGCKGYPPTFQGSDVWKSFPFDGERTWTWISTDESIPYKLVGHSIGEPEQVAGTNIYNVEYSSYCFGNDPDCVTGEILHKVKWSSDALDGTFVHAYALGTDPFVDFDPPLQITATEMKKAESVETATAGAAWTSTLAEIEPCPVQMSVQWDECSRFEVAPDAGDGAPIAGTYWAILSHGITAMELAGETGRWELSDVECAPPEDCDGSW